MPQIDPKVGFWLAITMTVVAALGSQAVHFPDTFTPTTIAHIQSWCSFILSVYAPISVVVNGYSSNKAGPLVNLPPQAKSPFFVGLLALGLLLLLAPYSFAAGKVRANPLNGLATWADKDIDAAIVASTANPDLQDQVGEACWTQLKTLTSLVKQHPLPLTLHLATDVEYARLVQAELNLVCRNPACAQVWADMANNVQALSVLPLPFSITSLCAKVPVVGLILPTGK